MGGAQPHRPPGDVLRAAQSPCRRRFERGRAASSYSGTVPIYLMSFRPRARALTKDLDLRMLCGGLTIVRPHRPTKAAFPIQHHVVAPQGHGGSQGCAQGLLALVTAAAQAPPVCVNPIGRGHVRGLRYSALTTLHDTRMCDAAAQARALKLIDPCPTYPQTPSTDLELNPGQGPALWLALASAWYLASWCTCTLLAADEYACLAAGFLMGLHVLRPHSQLKCRRERAPAPRTLVSKHN